MSDLNLLFGKIAVEKGFLTPEQLAACTEIQRKEGGKRPIGEIGKAEGFLHVEDLRDILIEQLLRFHSEAHHAGEKLADRIFGQVAVQKKHLALADLHRALEEQARRERTGKPFQRLGEVMVDLGLLTAAQVAEVLEAQDLTILICKNCVAAYNVAGWAASQRYICKICNEVLQKPERMSDVAIRQLLTPR